MRVLRWIGVSLLVTVLAVTVLAGVGGYVVVRASLPSYGGELSVRGLSGPVTVYRDDHGVPQVYASSATDLFRAQGFLHAQDRFWEMDVRRHITAGRLSEMFGKDQVETDAFVRALGWRRTAETEYNSLDPASRTYLQAYADGVNAWLDDHAGTNASLEYGVLGLINRDYEIERWDPVDSVAWLKAMAWDLRSNLTDELDRAQLRAAGLPVAKIEQLYPPVPLDRNKPIVARGDVTNGVFAVKAGGGAPTSAAFAAFGRLRTAMAGLSTLLAPVTDGIGSNSFVLAGSRTATGEPLLANDPHIGPSLPSVWYQMGLHCQRVGPECPFDVGGFTFAGVPGVVIGHNARIAWGFTNLAPDVTDLYLEQVDGQRYRRDGKDVLLTARKETIKIAGARSRTVTVRSTVHGPLLSALSDDYADLPATDGTRGYEVALRWVASDPSRTMDALFLMNQAGTWTEFRDAARRFAVPAQNLVYADVDGHIGYQAPGDIPIRRRGDGRWPAPGWDSAYDWAGRVPFDALPNEFDPPRGYIVTANQAVVGGRYPYALTADWDYGYRSQRIASLIERADSPLRVTDALRIQTDDWNANAALLTPLLMRAAPNTPELRLFEHWDHTQPASSAAAAYFNAIWRQVLMRTFDELPAANRPDGGSRWFEVMQYLLADPDAEWWDVRGTTDVEDRNTVLAASVRAAAAELRERLGDDPERWEWGKLHTLTLRNATLGESGIGPVEWLFNRGPFAMPGGTSIVNANSWDASSGYAVTNVPTMRMVVDLANLDRSRWINLAGASGHAFSKHYTDQTELWRTGRTIPMRWDRTAVRSEARYTQRLVP